MHVIFLGSWSIFWNFIGPRLCHLTITMGTILTFFNGTLLTFLSLLLLLMRNLGVQQAAGKCVTMTSPSLQRRTLLPYEPLRSQNIYPRYWEETLRAALLPFLLLSPPQRERRGASLTPSLPALWWGPFSSKEPGPGEDNGLCSCPPESGRQAPQRTRAEPGARASVPTSASISKLYNNLEEKET